MNHSESLAWSCFWPFGGHRPALASFLPTMVARAALALVVVAVAAQVRAGARPVGIGLRRACARAQSRAHPGRARRSSPSAQGCARGPRLQRPRAPLLFGDGLAGDAGAASFFFFWGGGAQTRAPRPVRPPVAPRGFPEDVVAFQKRVVSYLSTVASSFSHLGDVVKSGKQRPLQR